VPASSLDRGKQGFEAPIAEWLRGPLEPLASSLLLDGRMRERGLFSAREVSRLWQAHRTGRADHRHRLWQLLMLELWFRQFVDGPTRRVPAARSAAQIVPIRLASVIEH
jgi:asparagine synthase (glutamine-hydrolysing)